MKPSIVALTLALLLLGSCASAPPSSTVAPPASSTPMAPAWTSWTVSLEGDTLVFVLKGSEHSDPVALAGEAMAVYLDLPITPATPVVAVQAVQAFLKKMSATPPSDHYSQGGTSWWKVVLSKSDWDASRAHLKSLFESAADPSAELERQADDLAQKGLYFDAVTGYVAAAAAAAGHPPLAARYRQTLAKAQDLLAKFVLTSTTAAQTTRVGVPFPTTFDVKLTLGTGADAPAIPGAALRFSYKTKVNGRLAVTGLTVKTDAQGLAQFGLPTPDFSARDNVVVLVDVNPWLETLAAVPKELRDPVAGFETLVGDRKLQLPYTVESAAKQVALVVALADFDERGAVIRRQESSPALIAALQKAGFQSSGIPVNPTLLKSPNDNVILAAWRFQGKTSGRAVYGTVSLVSVAADGSQFKAQVSGSVKVADLATSKPVYQLKSTKVASAGDRASAITQAFRQWAAEAAAQMEAELP